MGTLQSACQAYEGVHAVDQGLAALIGAGVGGATATLAALIANHASRHQTRAQHKLWRAQARREVYAAYTTAFDAALSAIDLVEVQASKRLVSYGMASEAERAAVAQELADPRKARERARAQELLELLRPFMASAAIEGPESVRRAVATLTMTADLHLAALLKVAEDREMEEDQMRTFMRDFLSESRETMNQNREEFFSQVRNALDDA